MSTLIPYVPDECKLTFRWSTDVLKSTSGVETQRVCLEELPDILLESTYSFEEAIVNEVRLRKLGFFSNPLETFEIPWHFEAIGAVALGATTIDVVAANCPDWAIVSRRVYVTDSSDTTGTAHTINTVADLGGGVTRLTLSGSLAAYTLATVTICPLYTFQPEDGRPLGYHRNGESGQWVFRGRMVGGYAQGLGASSTSFNGYLLNNFRPRQNEEDIAGEEHSAALEFTDFGGTFTVDTGYAYSDVLREETYNIQGLAEWQNVKGLLWAVRGQQKSFWTPTWKPDLELYSQPTPGTATIRVTENPDIRVYHDSGVVDSILVHWSDGTLDYRTISTVTDGGAYLEITLSSNLSSVTGTVEMVSLIEKTRLSKDEVQVVVGSGCSMDVSFGLQTVRHAPHWPDSATEMRAAMGGLGTWVSAWHCEETAGSLEDAYGAVDLSPVSTPAYRATGPLDNDYAVRFSDSSSDGFHAASASTFDLGAGDSIAIYACIRWTQLLNRNFAGKSGPVANNYAVQFQSFPTGRVIGYVDSGATYSESTVDVDHWQSGAGNWHDVLYIIDRTNQRLQVFTELGASLEIDISTVGTLTNAVSFFMGAANSSTTGGEDIAFMAVATGDIPALRASGAAAIKAIRRFTGRLLLVP